MPRRNNRDRRFEPKEYNNENSEYYSTPEKKKPTRKRKDQWDKQIYKDNNEA